MTYTQTPLFLQFISPLFDSATILSSPLFQIYQNGKKAHPQLFPSHFFESFNYIPPDALPSWWMWWYIPISIAWCASGPICAYYALTVFVSVCCLQRVRAVTEWTDYLSNSSCALSCSFCIFVFCDYIQIVNPRGLSVVISKYNVFCILCPHCAVSYL